MIFDLAFQTAAGAQETGSSPIQYDADREVLLLNGNPIVGGNIISVYEVFNRAVTAAQLAALNTTPIPILFESEIEQANHFWRIVAVVLTYTPLTTPFTIGGATNFSIRYGSGAGPVATGTIAATGLIDQTVLTSGMLMPISCMVQGNERGGVPSRGNMLLCLAGGNPSGGDGELGVKILAQDPQMKIWEDLF